MGYIPRQEGKLLIWGQNFAAQLAQDPARYGLTAGDASKVAAAVSRFALAFATARQPTGRTAAAVVAKNAASVALQKILRRYAMPIKHRAGLSDRDKVELGLQLTPQKRTRVAAPLTWPVINLKEAHPLRHVLYFGDSHAEGGRKPAGACGLQLHYRLSPAPAPTQLPSPPPAPAQLPTPAPSPAQEPGPARIPPAQVPEGSCLAAFCSRPTFTMTFKSGEAGQMVQYWARWQTRTGKTGPWSQPLQISVMS